jgi:hypothetical protein
MPVLIKDRMLFYPLMESKNDNVKVRRQDESKATWDIFIIIVLIFSCLMIPYRVAFVSADSKAWEIINISVDICFLLDIFIIFNSAFYDDDYKLVDSRKKIAITYIKSWFLIDLISIIPLEFIIGTGFFNTEVIRIARIGRMYKLIKLARLIRIFKFAKKTSKLGQYIQSYFTMSEGMERILIMLTGFFLICHIVCCLWTICAQLNGSIEDTWMADYDSENLYLTAYYFIVTTITTVGYGDISGQTSTEKIFCIIIMVVGVVSFSFASGALASIMQNYDSKNA